MNTIGTEFVKFLCDTFGLTFGEDIYYIKMPDSQGPVYWVELVGSILDRELKTKQKIKEYDFILHYRDISAKSVDEEIFKIETILNRMSCVKLEHFELYEIKTTNLGTHDDLDVEGRVRGSIQISVKIHDDYSDQYSS